MILCTISHGCCTSEITLPTWSRPLENTKCAIKFKWRIFANYSLTKLTFHSCGQEAATVISEGDIWPADQALRFNERPISVEYLLNSTLLLCSRMAEVCALNKEILTRTEQAREGYVYHSHDARQIERLFFQRAGCQYPQSLLCKMTVVLRSFDIKPWGRQRLVKVTPVGFHTGTGVLQQLALGAVGWAEVKNDHRPTSSARGITFCTTFCTFLRLLFAHL